MLLRKFQLRLHLQFSVLAADSVPLSAETVTILDAKGITIQNVKR